MLGEAGLTTSVLFLSMSGLRVKRDTSPGSGVRLAVGRVEHAGRQVRKGLPAEHAGRQVKAGLRGSGVW